MTDCHCPSTFLQNTMMLCLLLQSTIILTSTWVAFMFYRQSIIDYMRERFNTLMKKKCGVCDQLPFEKVAMEGDEKHDKAGFIDFDI